MAIKAGSTDVQAIYVGSTPVQEVYVGSTKIWPASDCTLVLSVVGDTFKVSAGYINAAHWIDSSGNWQTTVTTFTHPGASDTVFSELDADQTGYMFLCSDGTVRAQWASTTASFDRVPIALVALDSSGSISAWQDMTEQVVPQ